MRRAVDRRGFALIVVLGTLSIIALIFAIASSRTVARLSEGDSEARLATGSAEERNLLGLALAAYGDGGLAADAPLAVTVSGEPAELRLRDVGGLIDLNTASPDMLDRLADALDLPAESLSRYRNWRRTPYRLPDVDDFARVAGVANHLARLDHIATVHSGRSGIAPESSPIALLELLAGGVGAPETLAAQLPELWITPPTNARYQVLLGQADQPLRVLGVVRLPGSGGEGQILDIR